MPILATPRLPAPKVIAPPAINRPMTWRRLILRKRRKRRAAACCLRPERVIRQGTWAPEWLREENSLRLPCCINVSSENTEKELRTSISEAWATPAEKGHEAQLGVDTSSSIPFAKAASRSFTR